MIVKFGNLNQPRHSESPDKPEAKAKIDEMMEKLHEAGFERQENVQQDIQPKHYHVFDLPHSIEFGSDVHEAVEIIRTYSDYMKPIAVVG